MVESSDEEQGEAAAAHDGRRPKVALVGLGCRVNRSDLDALAAGLQGRFDLVRSGEEADFVVVNTCTVTSDADSASRQAVRRAVREHPQAHVIAAGCYAEVCPEALAALPGVTAVVGSKAQTALPELLARLDRGEEPAAALEKARASAPSWQGPAVDLTDHTRAFLKIQDGCDARCSFCVVPAARGESRSLPFENALEQVAALGERHAEVVLAGVHLGLYGRDLSPRRDLAELVRAAARQKLIRRLRLSSIEPLEFPSELLEDDMGRILCEHFHIPLQSGSPKVLAAMRRPYRAAEYERLVERIAGTVPGACLGADVMVGFPGETDQDHRETLELVEALPLAYLHVFPFSLRPGTAAADLAERVPAAVVRERARELLQLSERRWKSYLAAQSGHVLEVVVERIEGGLSRGTSRQYVSVSWPARRDARGQLVKVRVEASDGSECFGVHAGVFSGRLTP